MSAEVQKMFASIAPGYDRTNQVLSLGVHRLWRSAAVRHGGAAPGQKVLDCATGTGDLALALKRAVGEGGEVVGTDFCAEMLAVAPAKAERAEKRTDAAHRPYRDRQIWQGEERRDQHHAPHAVHHRRRGKQRDHGAGRMGEDVVRPAAVGQHDLLEELLQVCGVVAEAPDIAALAIADQPVGIALAAPVEGGNAKAAIGKVADGFEIFLDALVAAGQDDHGALQRARDRCKQAVADLLAVTGGEEAASGIFRSRIALDFVKKGDFVDKIHHSALRAWRLACRRCWLAPLR